MDLLTVNKAIYNKIVQLDKACKNLAILADKKAETVSVYEKEMATTIIRLKNGVMFVIDGEEIINPQTTITEKIAKGICWKMRQEADLAESMYKNQIVVIDVCKAQLNGWQSINKYLSEVLK